MPAKIRVGDQVMVLLGKDKGRVGEVLRVDRKDNKALVQGINQARRHTRPTRDNEGGIIVKDRPLAMNKINVVDPEDNKKATRVGFKKNDKGKLLRFAKRSGAWLDKEKD